MGFKSHTGIIKTSQAQREANKRYKDKNKDVLTLKKKIYYETNKEEILEKRKLEYYLLKKYEN